MSKAKTESPLASIPDTMSGWCFVFADDSLHYYPVGRTTPLCGVVGMEPRKQWKIGRADLCSQCRDSHIKMWLNRGKK